MSDEFEYRSDEEINQDIVRLVLGVWGVLFAVLLSPLPVAAVILLGITILEYENTSRAVEWVFRNKNSFKYFLRWSKHLAAYPFRWTAWYVRTWLRKIILTGGV